MKRLLVQLDGNELNAIANTNPCYNFVPLHPDLSLFKGFATAIWNPLSGGCYIGGERKRYYLLDTNTPPFWHSWTRESVWWNVASMSSFGLCIAAWIILCESSTSGMCIRFNADLSILNSVDCAKLDLTLLAYNYEHNYFFVDVVATEEPCPSCCECCDCFCFDS